MHASFSVRPSADSLDNGNNKKALAEAEKVLKKQPDLQCCRALMALALLRLGRDSEAETHLNTLVKEAPTDEAVLQAMTIAYKELQQRKETKPVFGAGGGTSDFYHCCCSHNLIFCPLSFHS